MFINEKGEVENKTLYKNKFLNIFVIMGDLFLVTLFWNMSFRFHGVESIQNFFFLIGLFCLILMIISLQMYFVKYEIKEEGLWIKYPLEPKKLLKWNEFQQVCVCYACMNKLGSAYVVICCVKHGQKKTFWSGRWKTDNLIHYRSVITIDYTFELYKTFKKMCPYEVIDLRETPGYRHSAFSYHKYQRMKQQERTK